jgi:Uncharacterized conserved protein
MKSINLPIKEAKSFKDRFLGFMLKKHADYALSFENCKAVHTFFMRFKLDVLFLDKENKIIKEVRDLKPWRIAFCLKAYSVLEVPSRIRTGDK